MDRLANWNPWHGCHKLSPGCQHCYVYRTDDNHGRDSSVVAKTQSFDLPLRKNRAKQYKIPPDEIVYTCFTSDFPLEDAGGWRDEAWRMIRERDDLSFMFITKRIHRFAACVPDDWGAGYDHVAVGCTCENQDRADFRLPIFMSAPIKHSYICCEPLLERVHLSPYLNCGVEGVVVGGESGSEARLCDYEWVLSIRDQCIKSGVPFTFKQTGANFRANGKTYRIERKYQHSQARKAGINWPQDGN